MSLCSVEEAILDLQAGKMIIVVDDERRENEGDLVMAAEKVTPEAVNFMITEAKGLLCMPMTPERLSELNISAVSSEHTEGSLPTAFQIAVDYKIGTTTGISANEIDSHTYQHSEGTGCRPGCLDYRS